MHIDTHQAAALTQYAQALDWIDPDTTIDNLSIAGEGNMNCVVRAQLSNGGSLIFKQSLPYVAKYPDIAAPIERLAAEAGFYAAIATDDLLARRAPSIIGYDPEAWVLCMQDLGTASDFADLYTKAPSEQEVRTALPTLLTWLGRLHSLEISEPEGFKNPAMRALNHEHIFTIPLLADNGLALEPELAQFAKGLREDRTFIASADALGHIYLANPSAQQPSSLLHGDFYPGSWVRDDELGAVVIDPEFSFYGRAEFDLGVMVAHLLFTGMEMSAIERLLVAYGRAYEETLVQQFAGIEITRRLLGVAQLPLSVSVEQKLAWLDQAQGMVKL